MKTVNKKFYFVYLAITITTISLIILMMKLSALNATNSISKNYFQESFFQKERELSDIIYTYTTSIRSLHQNPYLYEYIVNDNHEKISQDFFLHDKRSLPLFFQIRYIDKNGNERIRVDGDTIALYKDEARSQITPKHKLQNKADKDYFKRFMKLLPGEVGYSVIDLNKDNGIVTLPKEPTLRIGMALYGNNQKPQGVLIYNISLRYFFIHLSQSLRYNFMMVDQDGNFLVHYNEKYGLLGDHPNYFLKDEFPDEYKNILNNNKYETKSLFSSGIEHFENTQNLKIILTLQPNEKNSFNRWLIDNITLLLFVCAFAMLPIVQYALKKLK